MACHACGLHYPSPCQVCGAVGDLSECGGMTRHMPIKSPSNACPVCATPYHPVNAKHERCIPCETKKRGAMTDLGGGMVRWEDGTVAFVSRSTDDPFAPLTDVQQAQIDSYEDGCADGAWRAPLERDIAEVERAVFDLQSDQGDAATRVWQSLSALAHYGTEVRGSTVESHRLTEAKADEARFAAQIETCQAWLVRARAVLDQ